VFRNSIPFAKLVGTPARKVGISEQAGERKS
jgi:hypothetical protein